jgi:hypothetical protein
MSALIDAGRVLVHSQLHLPSQKCRQSEGLKKSPTENCLIALGFQKVRTSHNNEEVDIVVRPSKGSNWASVAYLHHAPLDLN